MAGSRADCLEQLTEDMAQVRALTGSVAALTSGIHPTGLTQADSSQHADIQHGCGQPGVL